MRNFPATFIRRLTHRRPGACTGRLVLILAALLVAAGLLWTAPALLAQDGADPQPPDAATNFLFLPSVAGGAAVEAGTVIPGQFIVVLREPTARGASGEIESAAAAAERLAATVQGEVLYVYDAALNGFAVRVPQGQAELAAAALEDDPNVEYVEPDRVARVADTLATQTNATWGLDRIDQRSLPLNATYIYNSTGAGVHAYIIDTGMRTTHTQFSNRVGNGYTAINDGRGFADCNGHGTHVAGTVGGTVHGVAKGVTLHAVRVLDCSGSGSNSGVIAGVNWVTANRISPAVANMSLGGGASSALDTAVRNSIAAGVTYALAAGNENQNACNSSPARTAEAITVGATTSADARASYSNYGSCLDTFAPGSSITSAWYNSDTAVSTISGTSMASPHVAGAAALYLAVNPSASPAQVAQALVDNATTNIVTSPGTGSPNRLLYVGFIGGNPGPTPTSTPTPTATPVPPPSATPTATPVGPTPTPTQPPAACTNLLQNSGFESGRANWQESSTNGYTLICTGTSCGASAGTPRTGSWLAWLAGANNEASQISQTVTLPAAQKATLSFWHRITSSDTCGYDYGYVRVLPNGAATPTTVKTFNLCRTGQTSGWVSNTIDLSAYAGQTITLIFRATTDVSQVSSFFLDDTRLVSGNTCTAAAGDAAIEPAAAASGEDLPAGPAPKPQGEAEPLTDRR